MRRTALIGSTDLRGRQIYVVDRTGFFREEANTGKHLTMETAV